MKEAIKRRIRPFVLPCIHGWQWLHDYTVRNVGDYRDRRRVLRGNTIVAEDVHGTRFVLYPWDRPNSHYLYRHPNDAAGFQVIPRMVRPGDTAFDVGANIGIYSVLLSRLCGPTGRVWAFEPVADTYWRLRETLALNRCENVFPTQAAMCDRQGSVRMNLFEPQYAELNSLGIRSVTSVTGRPVSPCQSVEVPAHALDQFCDAKQIERINFLKVDVEGFELSVFRGAELMLREHRVDYICFEISKEALRASSVEASAVIRTLEAHGYVTYRLDGTTKRFQGPIQDTWESWANFFASYRDLSNLEEIAR